MPTDADIIDAVMSQHNADRINKDKDRFLVYNGELKSIVEKSIAKEFSKSKTVQELVSRIIPINIVQKIINKLAAIYVQSPIRQARDKNPADQELLDLYAEPFKMNRAGKLADRYFKLHKHTLWQPFLDREGIPKLRTLPSQTYTPFSDDPREPDRPTMIVKHLRIDAVPEKSRFEIWTDEVFKIVDGKGNVDVVKMRELGNEELINPFGKLPFVYVSDNTDGNLIPISDDDLICMQIVISVLLTDLAFASKYQLWSVIAITGVDADTNIEWNPNSIAKLPAGVEIEAIKPELSMDQGILLVDTLVKMLLATKNLSVGDIPSGQMNARNMASGVAKVIDEAQTTEDRVDQEQIFRDSETQLWDLFAHTMLPVWVESGEINPEFVGAFTPEFKLSIRFADQKPIVSPADIVNREVVKLTNGLTTQLFALREIFPSMDTQEIEDLQAEIKKEKQDNALAMQDVFKEEEEDGSDPEV